MKIKWENIAALILIALLVFGAVKVAPLIENIFEDMDDVYDYGPGRMLIKFLFFGLICVTAVTIAKFMFGNKQ
jgi:hypothetical protein